MGQQQAKTVQGKFSRSNKVNKGRDVQANEFKPFTPAGKLSR